MHNLQYFSTYGRSFVSMFVLVTTAKWVDCLLHLWMKLYLATATGCLYPTLYIHSFPDVMLESYRVLPYSPIFFIIYLVITLYIVGNLVKLYWNIVK